MEHVEIKNHRATSEIQESLRARRHCPCIARYCSRMAKSYLGCAKCCTLFSVTGIVFLVIIGALIQSQPLYIKGLTDHEKAATGCFEGALLYLVTLVISVGYWVFESFRTKAPETPRFGRTLGSSTGTNGSSGNLETVRFGGKYGAVVSDTFE